MEQGLQGLFQRAITSNEVLAVFIAAFLSGCGFLISRWWSGRGNIGWGVSNNHIFNLAQANPPVSVHTREIWVQNTGRAVAEAVEVVLQNQPGHYDVWPPRQFQPLHNTDGSFILKVDHLNPREFFTVSMLQANGFPPVVTNVRWRGGVANQVQMGPQQQFPAWRWGVFRLVYGFGFFSLMYFLVKAFSQLN